MIQQLQDASIEENTIGYDEAVPQSYYIGVFRYFMEFLESNERFVLSVLRSSASSGVQDLLSGQIQLYLRSHMRQEEDPAISDASSMLAALYAGAIVSCRKWWIQQENRPPKEAVIQTFSRVVMGL